MNFKEKTDYYISLTDNYIKKCLPLENPLYDITIEAMNYSIFAGGKRLRPILMLEFCRLCGGKAEDALPFAAAIEMIHTYSLIHDDMPSVDNDDYRRGKPSCHKKYGEAIALFAGDALLSKAFETAAESGSKNALKCIGILAKMSGISGMLGGQTVDKSFENKKLETGELEKLHSMKTGALIRACGAIGVLSAGAVGEKYKRAVEYCDKLGLAFQIKDDILDVTGDFEKLGKKTGMDSENSKNTFVNIYGLEKSQETVKKLTEEAIEALSIFDGADYLENLALNLVNREN